MKRILSTLLAAALLVSLTACGNGQEEPAPSAPAPSQSVQTPVDSHPPESDEPVYGGTAALYFMNLMNDYDPSAPDFENYQFWYERLFGPDWTIRGDKYSYLSAENLTGQLADTWSWDAASKTLSVTIHNNVYFQTLPDTYDYYGGRNLVAEDVKWSYDRLLGIGSGYTEPVFCMMNWAATLYMLDAVETEGDYTVLFRFNTDSDVAVSDFMAAAVNIAGHEWDELTAEQKSDWHYACGTGPYIISDYVEGATLELVKNENYYAYDPRYPENKLPYLDGITLSKITDNATLLSEFIAGQIDIIGNNESVFSVSEAAQLRNSVNAGAYQEFKSLITNRTILMKQTIEPLTHPEVRQALQYAINLDEVASRYFDMEDWSISGLFGVDTPFSTVDQWSSDLTKEYTTYDPELAKSMLAEAGYPDGFTITLSYVDDGESELNLLIQQYLNEVGVYLDLQPKGSRPELQAAVNAPTEITGFSNLGNIRLGPTLEFWRTGTVDYMLWGDEKKIDELVLAAENPTSAQDQIEKIADLDLYLLEQHYGLMITPCQINSYFVSGKIGGYNGENLYNSWNAGFIMARVWSRTGA